MRGLIGRRTLKGARGGFAGEGRGEGGGGSPSDLILLPLNKDKIEDVVFGETIKSPCQDNHRGVVKDSDLNLTRHIKTITKSAY